MDSFKEMSVALYGDRWLNRGIAVLAIDGPGQYEAPMVGINVSMENWSASAACSSIGSSHAARSIPRASASAERASVRSSPRSSPAASHACARARRGHLPRTGLPHDFRRGLTDIQEALHVYVRLHRRSRVRCVPRNAHLGKPCREHRLPVSLRRGRSRRVEPDRVRRTSVERVPGPKQFVVYAESRHSVGGVPSANLGPFPPCWPPIGWPRGSPASRLRANAGMSSQRPRRQDAVLAMNKPVDVSAVLTKYADISSNYGAANFPLSDHLPMAVVALAAMGAKPAASNRGQPTTPRCTNCAPRTMRNAKGVTSGISGSPPKAAMPCWRAHCPVSSRVSARRHSTQRFGPRMPWNKTMTANSRTPSNRGSANSSTCRRPQHAPGFRC